jgi:hypothetical protein
MDPYSGTARLVIYGLLVLAVLGAFARWRYVEGELTDTRREVARLEEDAQARAKNAVLAAAIAKRASDRDAARRVSDRKREEVIRNAAKPLPEACKDQCLAWYAPVLRAREFVRGDQQSGGAATTGVMSDVRP